MSNTDNAAGGGGRVGGAHRKLEGSDGGLLWKRETGEAGRERIHLIYNTTPIREPYVQGTLWFSILQNIKFSSDFKGLLPT